MIREDAAHGCRQTAEGYVKNEAFRIAQQIELHEESKKALAWTQDPDRHPLEITNRRDTLKDRLKEMSAEEALIRQWLWVLDIADVSAYGEILECNLVEL